MTFHRVLTAAKAVFHSRVIPQLISKGHIHCLAGKANSWRAQPRRYSRRMRSGSGDEYPGSPTPAAPPGLPAADRAPPEYAHRHAGLQVRQVKSPQHAWPRPAAQALLHRPRESRRKREQAFLRQATKFAFKAASSTPMPGQSAHACTGWGFPAGRNSTSMAGHRRVNRTRSPGAGRLRSHPANFACPSTQRLLFQFHRQCRPRRTSAVRAAEYQTSCTRTNTWPGPGPALVHRQTQNRSGRQANDSQNRAYNLLGK